MARRATRPPNPRNRNFLRQWREYRGLTQEQLAEKAGMAVSNISQFERMVQGYSTEGLAAWAKALVCEPYHILSVDPTKDAIWPIWERAKPAEREQIVRLARALVEP